MSRPKIEEMPHPQPCASCGRAARLEVNGKRTCWICFGTVKERKAE